MQQIRSVPSGCYRLETTTEGAFTVHDVPPGTYLLRARVTETAGEGYFMVVAEMNAEVVVPKGEGPFDAGTFVARSVRRTAFE